MSKSTSAPSTAKPQWLAIDTDAGVDDAVAICLALLHGKGFTTKLITTQFGNTSHANVKVNAAKCRRACGLTSTTGPRICVGADGPITGEPPIDAGYFHGKDGLGDAVDIDDIDVASEGSPHALDASQGAVDAILGLAAEAEAAEAELTLITLGPLTNLAQCLAREPSLTTRLSKTVLMGGCGNARGNISIVAEFNVAADPEAAAAVFDAYAAGGDLVVVPWELTVAYPLPWEQFDALLYTTADSGEGAGGGGPSAGARALLASACRAVYVTERPAMEARRAAKRQGGGTTIPDGAVICDALAVAVALDPDNVVTSSQRVRVDVELKGEHTRAMTVVDWGASFTKPQEPNCTWVTGVSVEHYAEALRRSIGAKDT